MAQYSPPKVTVNVNANPRIINISEDVRIPAIVGPGPTRITITDEVVLRGPGAIDYLASYPSANVTVSKVAKHPNLTYSSGSSGNDIDAITGLNGSLYVPSGSIPPQGGPIVAGYIASTNGYLTWPQDPVAVATGTVPSTGSTYYVTYSFDVPSSQFLPGVFSDKQAITNQYGGENNTTGCLTVAGSIALENGSPAVILCQISGSQPSEALYRSAIDQLRKKSNIEEVIVVFPSGSLPQNIRNNVHTYLFQHVQLMNLAQRWRGMFYGVGSPNYNPSDGLSVFDTIGDTSTAGSYVFVANQFMDQDVVLVAPSIVWRLDKNNNRIELDGSYACAAVAGVHAAQPLRSTPITGFTVTGINIDIEKWDPFQMNALGQAGVLVLSNVGGIITIRDAITTDPTSADTQEINVVSQRRLVERELSTQLFNLYTNKGKTIDVTTVRDVEASVRSILNALRNQNEIFGFGTKDDPNTGETKITAIQNSIEPRQIDVTASVKFLYPLKFLSVSISLFV